MRLSRLNKRISDWLVARIRSRLGRRGPFAPQPTRGPTIHVVILDGTMSSLDPGNETNAGLAMKLLREMGSGVSVYYEPGLQWSNWRRAGDVMYGRGINRQIRRAYGYLASRWKPGDRIFLLGYSRGAYAVRSLAGVIDTVGLLHAAHATERNIRQAYRHYKRTPEGGIVRAFAATHCHDSVEIEMIGAWDTVKSLGFNLPLLRGLSAQRHAFHSHHLGPSVKRGVHALARHETRMAYSPVMWASDPEWHGELVQMWFRGTHGDVGGHLGGFHAARPLANIPFVWLMEQAEAAGLPLPDGWQARYPRDATAPSTGTWRGWAGIFPSRRARKVGLDPSERVHPSVTTPQAPTAWTWPFFGAKPEA